jgi:hypothetical protein
MAREYSGFSSYKPFVGSYLAAAGLYGRLAEAARRRLERLSLQLLYLKASESMGNHDSKVVDADSVD